MAFIYKILFEVKLLHEYYFTDREGKTIFERATQQGRKEFLDEYYVKGAPSVTEVLDFEFPAALKPVYESHYLKLLPAYSGFKIATRVNKKTLEDGRIVYSPYVTLPKNLNIYIAFTKKSKVIDNFTNSRINPYLPSAYIFSNNISTTLELPFLTSPLSSFNANYSYEQGELVSFGDNIRGFFQNAEGDQWEDFNGTRYASENDRLLIPFQFNYSFPNGTAVKKAEFILKSQEGEIIKTIQANSTEALTKTPLDFSNKKERLDISPLFDTTLFKLEVNGDNYSRTHSLLFSSSLYNQLNWGVASITIEPANRDFRLLDNDGYLKRDDDGHPLVFEIPIKARFAYWRYANERGKPILEAPLAGYLVPENDPLNPLLRRLVSIRPKTISRENLKITKEGTTTTKKYFPNPLSEITVDKDGKLYYDIRVPESDLFRIN